MNKKICVMIFSVCLASSIRVFGVSLVYNLRIAQTTRHQVLAMELRHPSIFVGTLFGQFHKLQDGTSQTVGGGIASYTYSTESMYGRIIGAVGHVKTHNDNVCFSRTQTDDILFMGGYSHKIGDQATITASGLLGLPTHGETLLQGLQVGTGHVGIGGQLDASWKYASNHAIISAGRLVHFFPRNEDIVVNEVPECYRIHLGNLGDLFVAHSSNWGRHLLEIGYNPTFVFDYRICPPIPTLEKKGTAIRSSFYAAYLYGFLIKQLPSAFILGISYGFDHFHRPFANKYVVTLWASWGINF